MPNQDEHMVHGAAASIMIYLLRKSSRNEQATFGEVIGQGLIGAFGAALPDLIEPADNPQHRKTAHSVSALGFIGKLVQSANENPEYTIQQKDALTSLGVGYATHLFEDSQTPAGIPWI